MQLSEDILYPLIDGYFKNNNHLDYTFDKISAYIKTVILVSDEELQSNASLILQIASKIYCTIYKKQNDSTNTHSNSTTFDMVNSKWFLLVSSAGKQDELENKIHNETSKQPPQPINSEDSSPVQESSVASNVLLNDIDLTPSKAFRRQSSRIAAQKESNTN